jgi:hypothetical protein
MLVQFHVATIRDMTLLIAMPASPSRGPGLPDGNPAAMPELPALSAMLRSARRLPVDADWRSGVLRTLGIPAPDPHQAAIVARAVPAIALESGICLALPVHLVAGMSRMFLGASQSFALDTQRREELRQAFNAEFGGADLRLHAVGAGWLLEAPFAAAADDDDPENLQGSVLARVPAASAEGRSLRRLGTEVEMWLASLPFNVERERRGEPSINCIWFWGGAKTRDVPPPGRRPHAFFCPEDADPWIAGLAAHCGLPLQEAGGWDHIRDADDALVMLQPTVGVDPVTCWREWESGWFQPVWRDLQDRRLSSLRLQIGRGAWLLPGPRLTRWFRRARPWWQMVQT